MTKRKALSKINLLTSCFDCNRGKAAGDLTVVLPPIADQIRIERERAEQVKEFNRLLMELRSDSAAALKRLGHYWFDRFEEIDGYVFAGAPEASLKTFLKRLPEAVIMDLMDVACAKLSPQPNRWDHTFKYFCGCCWREIKKDGGASP